MGNVFASAEGAGFADIDATTDPAAFIAYLDEARARLGEAKLDGYAMFGVAPGQRLLDVGCGTGDDVIALAHMVGPAGHVTGVDASAAMLDEARRRAGAASAGNVEFVAGDAAKLDFPDSTFDGARADRVLQHVADPAAVIAEMARVVRPGGRVMTVDPDHTIVSVDAADDETAECILRTRAVQVRNPRIGRQLRGLFLDAGIDHVELVVRPMLFTDLAAFRAMFSLDASAQQAVELGLAPADAVRRCLDDLEARDRRGRFFAAAFGFRIVGRKPS